ncbi:MAG: nucleotidyl transferase AbiEii/AbiGii toxin family protein [Acidobacteria bacterium]|nr:nucleotidyl transferase AbiEii/AbiGii toxin family protein [Acidobacteriota bacterium]
MNEAIRQMLSKYDLITRDDYIRALREILQEIALLGLWRSKFFEKAAFYGGTALRILYGLDRFSEDLDFSLISTQKNFDLEAYNRALKQELLAFGFEVWIDPVKKSTETAIQSTFLKADTRRQLLNIAVKNDIVGQIPNGQRLKIKLEIDTDPPSGFNTESRFLLLPIPFSVRTYSLPDLFAGKIHALLFRQWKTRIKGRDWYDFVWFAANHPQLHLAHLEERMRQTGHWPEKSPLTPENLHKILYEKIEILDVSKALREVEVYVKNRDSLEVWSREFFHSVADRIQCI